MSRDFHIPEGEELNEYASGCYALAGRLFPICRSLTGKGVRETLSILKEYIPTLEIKSVPSNTQVFDWTVPKEWEINDAFIEDESGRKIIDFKENNLHVMGYSHPVDEVMDLSELKKHIYVQEDQPDVIPYVTSYYRERYGFCMSKNMLDSLPEGKYRAYVDSRLFDGNLNYGEAFLPGETDMEILFTTYVCHPSLANNECSGPALLAHIYKWLESIPNRKYGYRFVFGPETIGSVTYLSQNLPHLKQYLKAGFNLSCVGDDRAYSAVQSRYGNNLSDRVLEHLLKYRANSTIYSFLERGSDERQYCAPGVDLPFATFCRSKYTKYPEYHTSADDMNLISPEGFAGSFKTMAEAVKILEYNAYYLINVYCEPQLGKRGLYPTVSKKGSYDAVKTLTDFIAYADGTNDLLDIAKIINVPVTELFDVIDKLSDGGLLDSADALAR
ncbi:MAG: DUF4910 domain-containing protein [Lachnospiraceae bacterium]|nr:DUF4910 domain-containing protein [Lachnospiraceae bacterium]